MPTPKHSLDWAENAFGRPDNNRRPVQAGQDVAAAASLLRGQVHCPNIKCFLDRAKKISRTIHAQFIAFIAICIESQSPCLFIAEIPQPAKMNRCIPQTIHKLLTSLAGNFQQFVGWFRRLQISIDITENASIADIQARVSSTILRLGISGNSLGGSAADRRGNFYTTGIRCMHPDFFSVHMVSSRKNGQK